MAQEERGRREPGWLGAPGGVGSPRVTDCQGDTAPSALQGQLIDQLSMVSWSQAHECAQEFGAKYEPKCKPPPGTDPSECRQHSLIFGKQHPHVSLWKLFLPLSWSVYLDRAEPPPSIAPEMGMGPGPGQWVLAWNPPGATRTKDVVSLGLPCR